MVQGFYQEAGRAGRDGLVSQCVLMYDVYDIQKFKVFMRKKSKQQKKLMIDDLEQVRKPRKLSGEWRVSRVLQPL